MRELEYYHFIISNAKVYSDKDYQWMLKSLSKYFLRNSIFLWAQNITPQILINYKEEKVTLQWSHLAGPTTKWLIQPITNNWTLCVSWCDAIGSTHHHHLLKMFNLNVITRKQLDNYRIWNILQENYPVFFKDVNVMKDKRWDDSFRLKEIKETGQPKKMHVHWPDFNAR